MTKKTASDRFIDLTNEIFDFPNINSWKDKSIFTIQTKERVNNYIKKAVGLGVIQNNDISFLTFVHTHPKAFEFFGVMDYLVDYNIGLLSAELCHLYVEEIFKGKQHHFIMDILPFIDKNINFFNKKVYMLFVSTKKIYFDVDDSFIVDNIVIPRYKGSVLSKAKEYINSIQLNTKKKYINKLENGYGIIDYYSKFERNNEVEDIYKESIDNINNSGSDIFISEESLIYNVFLKMHNSEENTREALIYYLSRLISSYPLIMGNDFAFSICIPVMPRINGESIGGLGSAVVFNKIPTTDDIKNIYNLTNLISKNIVETLNFGFSTMPLVIGSEKYKNSLDIFSHHSGNLFKDSGVDNLENIIDPLLDYENLNDTYYQLIHLKQRLMIIWGLKEAINVIKEGFRSQWFCKPDKIKSSEETAEIIEQISLFIMAGQFSFLSEKNEHFQFIKVNHKLYNPHQILSKHIKFPSIPPFTEENNDGKKASSAVLFGLFELIRNACKAITKNNSKLLDSAKDTPCLEISISINQINQIEVKIKNISLWEVKSSESVSKIMNIERDILNNTIDNKVGKEVVKTSIEFSKEKNESGFYTITGTWLYYYNHLIEHINRSNYEKYST